MSVTDSGYLPAVLALNSRDEFSDGFFSACANGQLTVQRCESCTAYQHPPRAMCSTCGSFDVVWSPVSGRGTVFTYVIVHHPVGPVRDRVPYNTVLVELDDVPGVRMMSNVVDVAPDDVRVGLPVEVVFERVSYTMAIPRFRLAADGTA